MSWSNREYGVRVEKGRFFTDELHLWLRCRSGDPKSRDITMCGITSEGYFHTYKYNVSDETVELTDIDIAPIPLSSTAAQVLMDGLWECGVRPSSGEGNEGALDATKSHLADMRTIAFRTLADLRNQCGGDSDSKE